MIADILTIGDEILILRKDPATLQERGFGPFVVEQVHVNGTVTITRAPGIYERINNYLAGM